MTSFVWVLGIAAVAGYIVAAVGARPWPLLRTVSWTAGWCALVAVFVRADSAGSAGHGAHHAHDFVGHMIGHVVAGMAAPLLLVLAAPVTLALRVLPVRWGRRITRVLRSWPLEVLTHPLVAAILSVGGLWLLYRTWMFEYMDGGTWAAWVIQVHVVAAGYLYTFALVGVDPNPHRATFTTRAAVLVVSIAAHSILAKTLYAHPPPGVPAEQAELGSQVMYYGGLPFELALIVLLCHRWAAHTRRHRSVPEDVSSYST